MNRSLQKGTQRLAAAILPAWDVAAPAGHLDELLEAEPALNGELDRVVLRAG